MSCAQLYSSNSIHTAYFSSASDTYLISNSKNNFLYIKGFSGYGESIMDYNHPQNRLGVELLIFN
ncbi:phospholipase A [Sulfuricurvum sp.]|uniref:phospholipase A n=1 Tax=Sulfuricurvum sp. TaxID=2025608 RepID=UPI00261C1193|nr:phospholipase A [Sulfuricurvum sp.]MDD2266165.1 phospholipase A [Sulfuricurvum sp.]MDD2784536.1 phospholipase A [Sulfuricurvum sp.]